MPPLSQPPDQECALLWTASELIYEFRWTSFKEVKQQFWPNPLIDKWNFVPKNCSDLLQEKNVLGIEKTFENSRLTALV